MAVVGAGSPIQTMQYQALPFEALAYTPQILSQKHEALTEQYDMMGSIVPSDVPEEARPLVEKYTKELDSAVNDLTKSGYSFESRNKLSALRRSYNDNIKPIEGFNKLKAEADAIKNKAKLNTDLVASVTMPSFGEYRNGKTNYDMSVISKSEYAKLGQQLREQSTQTPFAEIVNGAVVSGLKSTYDEMTPDEVRLAALENPLIKQRLLADGIDPDKDGFDEVIDALTAGVMKKPSYTVQPYVAPKGGPGNGDGKLTNPLEEATLVSTNRTSADLKRVWNVDAGTISDINNVIASGNVTPALKQTLIEQRNKMENVIAGSDELKNKTAAVMQSKPVISEKAKQQLLTNGVSQETINALTSDNFNDVLNVEKLLTKLNVNSATNKGGGSPWLLPSDVGGTATGSPGQQNQSGVVLDPSVYNYLDWYKNKYKPVEEDINKALGNDRFSAGVYTPTTTTSTSNLKALTTNALTSEDVIISEGTHFKEDGEEQKVKPGKLSETEADSEVRTNINYLLNNNTTSNISIVEPSADENIPPQIIINGKLKDGSSVSYTLRLPDTNETFTLFKKAAIDNKQPILEAATADYFLKYSMNANGGRLPLVVGDDFINDNIVSGASQSGVKASQLGIPNDAHIRRTVKGYGIYVGEDNPINGSHYRTLNEVRIAANQYVAMRYNALTQSK